MSKGFGGLQGLSDRRDTDTGCDCIVVICSYSSLCVWVVLGCGLFRQARALGHLDVKSLERKNGTQTRKLSKVSNSYDVVGFIACSVIGSSD